MTAPAVQLGDRLADGTTVYRAFSLDGHRRVKATPPHSVRRRAYYRSKDHEDGLSVGLTPEAAVSRLQINFGYCSLPVEPVHKLPYNLCVHVDLAIKGHALICRVPPIDGNDEEREIAEAIAGELARLSRVETCEPYPPASIEESPLPTI